MWEIFIDSLDTVPRIIIIFIDLGHFLAGHVDKGDEGDGNEDVASREYQGADLASTHPELLIKVNPGQRLHHFLLVGNGLWCTWG